VKEVQPFAHRSPVDRLADEAAPAMTMEWQPGDEQGWQTLVSDGHVRAARLRRARLPIFILSALLAYNAVGYWSESFNLSRHPIRNALIAVLPYSLTGPVMQVSSLLDMMSNPAFTSPDTAATRDVSRPASLEAWKETRYMSQGKVVSTITPLDVKFLLDNPSVNEMSAEQIIAGITTNVARALQPYTLMTLAVIAEQRGLRMPNSGAAETKALLALYSKDPQFASDLADLRKTVLGAKGGNAGDQPEVKVVLPSWADKLPPIPQQPTGNAAWHKLYGNGGLTWALLPSAPPEYRANALVPWGLQRFEPVAGRPLEEMATLSATAENDPGIAEAAALILASLNKTGALPADLKATNLSAENFWKKPWPRAVMSGPDVGRGFVFTTGSEASGLVLVGIPTKTLDGKNPAVWLGLFRKSQAVDVPEAERTWSVWTITDRDIPPKRAEGAVPLVQPRVAVYRGADGKPLPHPEPPAVRTWSEAKFALLSLMPF
jgi:hypothetical protein